jgi:ABC-type branched-subunit amino acid transport system substrate-binding protein
MVLIARAAAPMFSPRAGSTRIKTISIYSHLFRLCVTRTILYEPLVRFAEKRVVDRGGIKPMLRRGLLYASIFVRK